MYNGHNRKNNLPFICYLNGKRDLASFPALFNMEASGLKLNFWENGPKPGQFYSFPGAGNSTVPGCGPIRHTL